MLVLGLAASAGTAYAETGGTAAPEADQASATETQTAPAPEPAEVEGEDVGGAEYGSSASKKQSTNTTPIVDGFTAQILPDGRAAAPAEAPYEVQRAIWAANRIIGKPYIYGGGHKAGFKLDRGYDCSGTVSWALNGGRLLKRKWPLDSSSFMKWGSAGAGDWVTVYTNPGHAYVVIAGLRLDTSAAGDPSGAKGPRWRPTLRSSKGFTVRHPVGF
jgi:cell wall-associated NlpC family hydrolase